MKSSSEEHEFSNMCFLSITLSILVAAGALFVYFRIPQAKDIVVFPSIKTMPVKSEIPHEETEELIEENFEDFIPSFQEYLADVSNEKLNDNSDNGLTLYRQTVSRPAVEKFYTHITGDKEIAQAILSEAEKNEIPLTMAFSLAYIESHYNSNAINKNSNTTTDRGLFQLNSDSFPNLTEQDFFDPYISSKYGMSHLKFCLTSAGNDVSGLAMYNAGTNRVRSNKTPQSTLNYVGKILTYQKMLDELFDQEVASYYESQIHPAFSVAYVPNK